MYIKRKEKKIKESESKEKKMFPNGMLSILNSFKMNSEKQKIKTVSI
jgi:hypothetical protein